MSVRIFWEITHWEPNFAVHPGQCGFAIAASPEFMQAAKSLMKELLSNESLGEFSARYNKYMSDVLKERGMGDMIFSPSSVIKFDKVFGLNSIIVRGNACQLSLQKTGDGDVEQRGASYETHNVDNSMQFLTLFLIFKNWWARHVENKAVKLGLIDRRLIVPA